MKTCGINTGKLLKRQVGLTRKDTGSRAKS